MLGLSRVSCEFDESGIVNIYIFLLGRVWKTKSKGLDIAAVNNDFCLTRCENEKNGLIKSWNTFPETVYQIPPPKKSQNIFSSRLNENKGT